MIKLKDLLNEATSPVKIGSALPGLGGSRKEIEIIVDKFMGSKWKYVVFNLQRNYVSGVGTMPDRMINYDDIFKLSSSQKSKIKKILKNPEDIDYIESDSTGIKVRDVLRAIR